MGQYEGSHAAASAKENLWAMLLFVILGLVFSEIIPPFQSPDEFDHIKRAYLLTKGMLMLEAPQGQSSGGMIDSGLAAYMAAYAVLPAKHERRLSKREVDAARAIKWSGTKEFSPAPGTAYYFPMIYAPQAIGLAIGERWKFSVDASYRLARKLTLLASAAILLAAFSLCSVNPLTIGLLILPMSLFQFSSASIDGISTALSIFAISAFLRITLDKKSNKPWIFYSLALAVVLLVTSRVHLLPLLLLLFAACFYSRQKKHFIVFALSSLLVLVWLLIAIRTTIDTRVVTGAATSSIALFYLKHPLSFFTVLSATLSNKDFLFFYRDSFIGMLGWLDTRFDIQTYEYFSVCIALIALLSISIKNAGTQLIPRGLLFLGAFASACLVFFALLVTWTPHPANIIQGVQGRYFLIPAIMLAYAISGRLKPNEGINRKLALLLILILGELAISSTAGLLLERYYLAS